LKNAKKIEIEDHKRRYIITKSYLQMKQIKTIKAPKGVNFLGEKDPNTNEQ
jgi:hypothetical protein